MEIYRGTITSPIYRNIEIAHSEVYGYGFRPYELLPPASGRPGMISLAEKQEAEMGMYSLRSWLYPRLYILVFHAKEWIGSTESPLMVGKVFHTIVAGHLPLAVYAFAVRATHSPDVATSAAILVASSEHLQVFGTHTLINSFLSPFVFIIIACLHGLLIHDPICVSSQTDSPADAGEFASPECADDRVPSQGGAESETPRSDINGNATSNGYYYGDHRCKVGHKPGRTHDMDNNKRRHRNVNGTHNDGAYMQLPREDDSHGPDAGDERHDEPINGHMTSALPLTTCGFGAALLCYMRVDLVLFFFIIGCIVFSQVLQNIRKNTYAIVFVLIGYAVGVVVGGLDDIYSYATFALSPIQWYKFNIHTNFANTLFGLNSSWTYIEDIILYSVTTRVQTLLILGTFVYVVGALVFNFSGVTHRDKQLFSSYLRILLATALLFIVYTFKGHKEVRFLHNVIVLFQITSALSFIIIYRKVLRTVQIWQHAIRLHGILAFVLVIGNIIVSFPSADQVWAYNGVWDSRHINECLDFIGRQRDVHGLVSDRSLHETAGYTVLHRDVPIFTLVHYEFHEFDQTARKVLAPTDYFSARKDVRVSVVSKLSNFITTENSPLLLKTIVNEANYNYLLLKKTRKLVNIGFDEVFSSGTMRVMRRTDDVTQNEALQRIADGIPVGTNATVLEYEGSWLMTYGLRQLATERLETAVTLDKSRIRAYQLLGLIYRDIGRVDDSRNIITECYRHNGKESCNVIQPKIVLHRDYPQAEPH